MSNPVPHADSVFLKHFVQLIVALMIIAVGLIAIAAFVYQWLPDQSNSSSATVVDARLAPVGGVHAGETGRAAIAAAAAVAAEAAAGQVAYGGTTDGKTIYESLCNACHTSGAGGSPMLTDKTYWATRVSLGADTLIKHAIEGYTGSKGVMPARGGNPALTDEQVASTVNWMIEQVQ